MIRSLLLLPFIMTFAWTTQVLADGPVGQTHIGSNQVLRGHFDEERQFKITENPMKTSGAFVAAPAHGLIWAIEKPFPTSTIVTPDGVAQDIGGMVMKLPAKNLQHLYGMIAGALAGDWSELDADFIITHSGNPQHWQMLLTPRPDANIRKTYAAITVSGGAFIDTIVMAKLDSTYDSIAFSNVALSSEPLTANEAVVFREVKP